MALFALLTDDKLAIKEIRDFPVGTVFKPGYAFPVVFGQQPVFDPALSYLVQQVSMPVNGIVNVTYVVTDLPQLTKDNNAKIKALKDLFDAGDAIELIYPSATNQQQKDLGRIAFQLVRKMKQALLDIYRP
jgi:hypothetical protein